MFTPWHVGYVRTRIICRMCACCPPVHPTSIRDQTREKNKRRIESTSNKRTNNGVARESGLSSPAVYSTSCRRARLLRRRINSWVKGEMEVPMSGIGVRIEVEGGTAH